MAFVKFLLVVVLIALSAHLSAGLPANLLKSLIYSYRYEGPDGSKREEMAVLLNPGTPQEELVVMGMHDVYDEKSNTNTVTMFTADKNGYRSMFSIKRRNAKKMGKNLSITALKSSVSSS